MITLLTFIYPFLLSLLPAVADDVTPTAIATLNYNVLDESQLYISGTSNVNDFACYSYESFGEQQLTYDIVDKQRINISKGSFYITTSAMDCGKKQITKDFLSALRAEEYPQIKILLNALELDQGKTGPDEWGKAVADTDIIIAGCGNHKFLDVDYKFHPDETLEARSSTKLCISDFGIEPPKALFGLIKVDDEVVINMHMFIEVSK